MSDLVFEGTATAPEAAAAVVSSGDLGAGVYQVSVSVHLEGSGTPASADLDNLALYSGSTEVGVLSVPEAKAVLFRSPDLLVSVADQTALAVQAVGNATAAVTYAVQMVVRQTARFK